MNWFRNRNENYPLSADESARGRAKAVNVLMFVVLGSEPYSSRSTVSPCRITAA